MLRSSVAERSPHKAQVAGSTPAAATGLLDRRAEGLSCTDSSCHADDIEVLRQPFGREVEVPGDVEHPLVLGQHVTKDFLETATPA